MNMVEIKKKAKKMGIKPGKQRKADLIKTIQVEEGNSPCFQSEIAASCRQEDCCWRQDCQ